MSKAKFAAVKELIDEKQYTEARAILRTIDHPTAREWEAKLDAIAPPVISTTRSMNNRYVYNVVRVLLAIFLTIIVLVFIFSQVQKTALDIVDNHPEIANSILSTGNSQLAINPSSTAAIRSTPTKETVSVQDVSTATPPPSLTITNTLVPSATPTFTITPTFTTAPPTTTPVKLVFSDNKQTVLGPMAIPAGLYKLKATTTGYIIATLTATTGECGAGTDYLSSSLFLLTSGQAANGAETLFTSKGCTALIEISNVQANWKLEFERLN